MNIAISISENYIPYSYIMLTSLCENNRIEPLNVYILHGGIAANSLQAFNRLTNAYNCSIYFLEINKSVFGDKLPRTNEWTIEIYYRFTLPELLPPEIDKILYLDVDTIILDDLSKLYHMDLKGKSVGACKDMGVLYGSGELSEQQSALFSPLLKNKDYSYFNSGVLLMDIAKMRKEKRSVSFFVNVGEKIADYIAGDQDIFNYVFHNDVVYADEEKYNIFGRTVYNMGRGYEWVKEHGVIVHFVGRKPWQHEALRYNTEKLFWEYAKKTPYYTYLLESLLMKELESGFMETTFKNMERENNEIRNLLTKCMNIMNQI